jgi:rbsD or fucU transport
MPSLDAPEAVRLIVELMPLDTFVEAPVQYMTGAAGEDMREVTRDVLDAAARTEGRAIHGAPLDRFDFYERARAATIVVHTQETRPYGCCLLTKGVLPTFGPEPAS